MAKSPELAEGPAVKTVQDPEPKLAGCQKGSLVRLLVPFYDGYQRFETGAEIYWPFDEPPLAANAALASAKVTPLDAPPMTSGEPPADYIDPATNEPLAVQSA